MPSIDIIVPYSYGYSLCFLSPYTLSARCFYVKSFYEFRVDHKSTRIASTGQTGWMLICLHEGIIPDGNELCIFMRFVQQKYETVIGLICQE